MIVLNVYLASSWKNPSYPSLAAALKRKPGIQLYDFQNPWDKGAAFNWEQIDENWENWNVPAFREALNHPVAKRGFESDFGAMKWADVGILAMPCGRSAHMEAGYFIGAGKSLLIWLPEKTRPELSYSMATAICSNYDELFFELDTLRNAKLDLVVETS